MIKAIDKLGEFLKNWKINKKTLAIIFVVLFVVSLVPIIITLFYSVPMADDYGFGERAHKAYINGDSFFGGVLESCSDYYNYWQGFYSSNFIQSMQPFNIDVGLYWVYGMVYLLIIIFSTFYFAKVVIIDLLKATWADCILITLPLLTVFFQFIPGVQEAIYSAYSGLGLTLNFVYLFIYSLVIKYHISSHKKTKIVCCILSIVIAIAFSGTITMYVTVLMFTFIAVAYCIYKRSKTYKLLLVLFVIFTMGLIISLLAPGNAQREAVLDGYSLPMAVIRALAFSAFYVGNWFTLAFAAVLAFVSIVFYSIAKKSPFSFKNPLLVFTICYLVYAGRISVQLYAAGTVGGWRQLNCYYLGFVLCFTISTLYFVGWLSKKVALCGTTHDNKQIPVVVVLLIAFFLICGTVFYAYDNTVASLHTTISLMKGETQQYHNEMIDRIAICESSEELNLEFKTLSSYPRFFKEESLSTDKNHFANVDMADYYSKESIVLVE